MKTSLSEDHDDENKEKTRIEITTNPQNQSLSANGSQNTMKRKSLSEYSDDEKKKKTKKATTSSQSSKSLCDICLVSVKDSKIFKNGSCSHPFCTKCISKYVKVLRKEKVVTVKCPDPECSIDLKPENLQSILPKKVIVDWESAICESSIDFNQKIYCPYKNCSLLLVNDGEEGVTGCECCNCPSCHRLFCAQCKVPWHADMNCEEFQKIGQAEYKLDRKFLTLAKRRKWQRCPKCSMHVQRASGCKHMTCRLYILLSLTCLCFYFHTL